jgi:hypothetical protein
MVVVVLALVQAQSLLTLLPNQPRGQLHLLLHMLLLARMQDRNLAAAQQPRSKGMRLTI